MEERQPLPRAVVQFRKRMLYGLTPLCLFVAGYCLMASARVRHSHEFYTGLRWSVMAIGGIMAVTSYCWRHPKVCAVFVAVAMLFNPILEVHLSKGLWQAIDWPV